MTHPAISLEDYDTDKLEIHLNRYLSEFGTNMTKPGASILELGVRRGGSLLLWADLFPDASVTGIDVDEVKFDDPTGRIRIYRGYQQDTALLDQVAQERADGGFDVIVDDASHVGEYTAASFWHLFTHHLKPGGIYVIDDWATGYDPTWADGATFKGRLASGRLTSSSTSTGTFRPAITDRFRQATLPKAESVPPFVRRQGVRLYRRVERLRVDHRMRSHDYGMVGFVKQLVDEVSFDNIAGYSKEPYPGKQLIERMAIYPGQVFVRKLPG